MAEMTETTVLNLLPTPVTGPPKPLLLGKTCQKEEKFGTGMGNPTVKRVVEGPLWAA